MTKESMTGFAPATIGVILECNKASEANVLTTTPHGQSFCYPGWQGKKAYIECQLTILMPVLVIAGGSLAQEDTRQDYGLSADVFRHGS